MNVILNDRTSTTFEVYSYGEIVAHSGNPVYSSHFGLHWWPSQATGEILIGGYISSNGVWYDYSTMSISSFNTVSTYTLVAFENTNVTDVVGNVMRGPYDMFFRNDYLKTVNLPFLEQLGWGGFTRCPRLEYVSLPNLRMVRRNTFFSCPMLRQIYLPKCSYIESNAFQSCVSMSWASFPECTYIDEAAFVNDYALEYVYIGGDCQVINEDAFYGCSVLSELILDCPGVPSLSGGLTFGLTPLARGSGHIYVRSSLVDTYKSAAGWSSLSSVITPLNP